MRLFTNLDFSQKLHVGPAIVPTNTIDTIVNLANRLVLQLPQPPRLRFLRSVGKFGRDDRS